MPYVSWTHLFSQRWALHGLSRAGDVLLVGARLMVVAQFCGARMCEVSELNTYLKLLALSCQSASNESGKLKSSKSFDSILNGTCPADFVIES